MEDYTILGSEGGWVAYEYGGVKRVNPQERNTFDNNLLVMHFITRHTK